MKEINLEIPSWNGRIVSNKISIYSVKVQLIRRIIFVWG
jgi:hypothetical protein